MTDRWWDKAACKGQDPDMFFDPLRASQAAAFCAECPVKWDCEDDAKDRRNQGRLVFGIWGGMNYQGLVVGPAREPGRPKQTGKIGRPTLPAEHGTDRGYKQHLRNGEDPCDPCLTAHNEASRESKRRARARARAERVDA